MNYEKLTLDRFALNLKEGKYVGITGARRAIGKTDWPEATRLKAMAMANRHDQNHGAWAETRAPKTTKKAAARRSKKTSVRNERPTERVSAQGKNKSRTPEATTAAAIAVASDGRLPRCETLADLLQTAGVMTQMFESMQKAAQADSNIRPQLPEAFKGVAHMLNILRLTTENPQQVLTTGRARHELEGRRKPVPATNVAPVTHVDVEDEDLDESQKKSQRLFEETHQGRAAGAR